MRQKFSLFLTCFFLVATAAAQTTKIAPSLLVTGEVSKPLKITAAELGKMKQDTASLAGKDGKTQYFSGVAVKTILALAGVTIGAELKGENLAKYLLIKCADGYQVVFSLAELDESFTNRVVILADKMEGHPLAPDRGPFRLIVPGEKKPARSSHQVTEFIIKFAR